MKYLKLYESFILESKEETKGILYPLSEGGKKTLILLPGSGKDGGQGKDDFQSLANTLGKDFSVYSADFVNEFNVRDYAQNMAKEIETNDDIKKCAVGGFSIGGAMAWHLAMALKGSDKFNNQLFFIDSGISNSTEEFAEGIVKGNTPRVAMAQPLDIFIKNRAGGGDITPAEQEKILHFYNDEELKTFKLRNDVKDNYLEYMGSKFPPSTEQIKRESKNNNPWIIEDKYDKIDFEKRYSVKPKEVNGKSFKEGDVINNRRFVMEDTLKKKGLGRETESGEMLPPLNGVEVISLIAGNKEGKAKSPEEIKASKEEAKGSTTGISKVIVISSEHKNITKSKDLATEIANNFN
jgi:hypothetical protein